ncbi:DUF1501 domain-containing protein [Rhodopirellula sp.]|nr:DUF1501 domain-containing protein [Rhodopirellula sp.]MDB4679208.1 DUF1501 domain-containing protein [Rhodopirellula sp.]
MSTQTTRWPNQPNKPRLCDVRSHLLSRRTLLSAGTSGWMLSSIAHALSTSTESTQSDPAKPKNVIVLWLEGGPSQLETFDPHPGGIYGGDTKSIETTVSGLQISDLLPQTAEIMHHASLIRSVTCKEGDHERAIYNLKSGYRPDPTLTHPSIGAILCQADQSGADIPRHISIVPNNTPGRGGFLGAKHDAFKVNDPASPVPDINRPVSESRYERRIHDLYSIVETEFKRGRLQKMERDRTLHQSATDAALKMMSSDQLDAFDVTKESIQLRESFGDSPFGRGCLAAVRLIESGARCVEVTLGGWDSHITNHRLQSAGCKTLDPALASLVNLLKERELFESTLLVCGGEFGRTPNINPAEGRDHWPHGFSLLLAGCGIRQGTVHGATAAKPKLDPNKPIVDIENPVTIEDVHATLYTALGLDPHHEYQTPIGRPIKRSEGKVIKEILS